MQIVKFFTKKAVLSPPRSIQTITAIAEKKDNFSIKVEA
jgi:hypothetical protein